MSKVQIIKITFKSGRIMLGDARTIKEQLKADCDKMRGELSLTFDYTDLCASLTLTMAANYHQSLGVKLGRLRLKRDLHDLIVFYTKQRTNDLELGLCIDVLEQATFETFEL